MITEQDIAGIKMCLKQFSRDELEAWAIGAYLISCAFIGMVDADIQPVVALEGVLPPGDFCKLCADVSRKFHEEHEKMLAARN